MESSNIKHWIQCCLKVVDKYKWLLDLYVLDFFVDGHWEQIRDTWKRFLKDIKPEDLAFLIDVQDEEKDYKVDKVWPLELLALKASVKAYSLPRQPWTKADVCKAFFKEDDVNSSWKTEYPNELKHVFRKHIKPKKQHEITTMSDLASMFKETKNRVDVGSGLGHLSRLLAFGHNLDITCLEAQGQFGNKALQFDQDLVQAGKLDQDQSPKHVTLNLSPDLDSSVFDETIHYDHFGMVGLHTCGDLGPTLVRLFAQSSKATHLQSVGCCYMHIKTCFPLSLDSIHTSFSYTVLELACHAIETYKDRLKSPEELEKLKVHCRRALLELIIHQKQPALRKSMLKTVKNSHQIAFEDYAMKATQAIQLNLTTNDIDQHVEKLQQWMNVVAFYTLRLLFSPLLETILLLDRCLYLKQQGLDCLIAPIFDPRKSPRNFVILAKKK